MRACVRTGGRSIRAAAFLLGPCVLRAGDGGGRGVRVAAGPPRSPGQQAAVLPELQGSEGSLGAPARRLGSASPSDSGAVSLRPAEPEARL